ncbi:C40 family peptidase [Nocardioides sp. W3-2-3]|uniref:C40 family peptidase n=1 Tax=Nocardioides convexus TaxID=2712224 RepID=UPI0024186912|nr:NlpC/P60 family protein [Nocardioides convexus]NGZ99389.1 C40 family peptidase [Nocardioides convexus]
MHFGLVAIGKSEDTITLTLEDAIVAALRRHTKPLSVAANKTTRRGFAVRLAKEAGVKYSIDPGHPEKVHNPLQRSADGQVSNSWEVLGSDVAEPINWRRFSDGQQTRARRRRVAQDRVQEARRDPRERRGRRVDRLRPRRREAGKHRQGHRRHQPDLLRPRRAGHPLPGSARLTGRGSFPPSRDRSPPPAASLELVRERKVLKEPKATGGGRGRKKSSREKGDPDYLPGQGGKGGGGRAGNAARERMVQFALAQNGKPYVWGGNGPGGYDCSGLVQAASRAAGKTLGKPAASQWATCRSAGKTISIRDALGIRGALLFRIGSGEYNHVAISLGNGSTVEARGRAYGCGVFGGAAGRGWTGAALWL